MKERSCGAIVYTMDDAGSPLFLLIKQKSGQFGFPKGHMEPGETERDTALREIHEETGITVSILDGFREEENYPVKKKPGVTKDVIYFIARANSTEIHCQVTEVLDAAFVPFEKAVSLLDREERINMLQKANAIITAKNQE